MKKTPGRLRDLIPTWKMSTLAQRLEDSRLLLRVHGYLGDVASGKIKRRIRRDWEQEEP